MQTQSRRLVTAHDHPGHYSDGRMKEHRCIAENALGHTLSSDHPVHHVDGKVRHNVNRNLVICQDGAYHALLHVRTRALRESGSANNRWCTICKTWDRPENIIDIGHNTGGHHECKKKADAERYAANIEHCRVKNSRNYILRKQRQAADKTRLNEAILITIAHTIHESKFDPRLYLKERID